MRDKRSLSSFKFFPPITRPAEKLWYPPMLLSTSKIWTACILVGGGGLWVRQDTRLTSSLVGEMIKAPRPS